MENKKAIDFKVLVNGQFPNAGILGAISMNINCPFKPTQLVVENIIYQDTAAVVGPFELFCSELVPYTGHLGVFTLQNNQAAAPVSGAIANPSTVYYPEEDGRVVTGQYTFAIRQTTATPGLMSTVTAARGNLLATLHFIRDPKDIKAVK